MKLIACLTLVLRDLERPGRIGVMYLAISVSMSGGIISLKIHGIYVQQQKN